MTITCAVMEEAAAQVAAAAPAPDPELLRRNLDVLLPLIALLSSGGDGR